MKVLLTIVPILFVTIFSVHGADKVKTTYFDCKVKEKYTDADKKKHSKTVHVYFAIKGLDSWKGQNELVTYPGISVEESEEMGLIVVRPQELPNGRYPMMSNLNGQGGDLRVYSDSGNVRLFGDGSGYQFTDLIEGYVRDYGPTYGNFTPFKQFIKCKTSTEKPFKLARK